MSDAHLLTRTELAESLLFFRRRLAARITVELIRVGKERPDPVRVEDLANAICERLAARETGDPEGYEAQPFSAGWLPIDTAPRDAILWLGRPHSHPIIGWWKRDQWAALDGEDHDLDADPPTHYMLLRPVPSETQT